MDGPKNKKQRVKPPRSRPEATAGHAQPAPDAAPAASLSAFSPAGTHFALVAQAVDKHRLRVYDALTGRCTAEHIVESAKVSSLAWAHVQDAAAEEPSKKKRKKRDSLPAQSALAEALVLGLASGSILIFSPTHGRVLSTLAHPSSTAPILAVAQKPAEDNIWTSGADGHIRLWSPSALLGTWKAEGACSAIALRPTAEDSQLLTASHTIRLLSLSDPSLGSSTAEVDTLAAFTGHASPLTALAFAPSSDTRFFTTAEGDRFVYIWDIPALDSEDDEKIPEGKLAASIPLDADVRHIALASPAPSADPVLLALSTAGRLTLYPVPAALSDPALSKKAKQKVPTLTPRSAISLQKRPAEGSAQVLNAALLEGTGQARIVTLLGGVRPVFSVVDYLDDAGAFVPEVAFALEDAVGGADKLDTGAPIHRYSEPSALAVRSGLSALAQDEEGAPAGGELDADMAELTLGERLAARRSDDEGESDDDGEAGGRRGRELVPAQSLTRTLIQALHSADARLLETCLAHADPALIANTVRRLPPQLAVPLLDACVVRLGRGSRGESKKGGGAGVSSERGKGLVRWVRAVCVAHVGYLMTMPDLVGRLAGLHATLTARLALQDALLGLSGRLEMVLGQIEMRASAAPAQIGGKAKKGRKVEGGKDVQRYVEGESSDEEIEVEVEKEDEGSVEDVELGGSDEESEESESDEEDDDDDEDEGDEEEDDEEEDDGEVRANGFVDDEAEEWSEESEDSE